MTAAMPERLWTAVGLMSGTSLDGIDAALVRTDGFDRVEPVGFVSVPYTKAFRARLRGVLGGIGAVMGAERALTLLHVEAVRSLLRQNDTAAEAVDVVGFHGHTVLHQPEQGRTWQIGDGPLLAARTGIDVVYDLRSADVAAGGEGAPLAPVFHRAMTAALPRPAAVLNIGGVANVTWIGPAGDDLVGFDTGPGNALIDDWMLARAGQPFDRDGAAAARGQVAPERLARLMAHRYFQRPPPKSLDRDEFRRHAEAALDGLSVEDGAALLTRFTVECVVRGADALPSRPEAWMVAGGGRHNAALMALLEARLGVPVTGADALGWDADAVEAQAFAYLAVRSLQGLPISFPGTTGVARPLTGGVLARRP
jgi:anhydro-N-acetylmuramic acid kinase